MQTIIHRETERGGGDYGWLRTRYSFSFADWKDPLRMNFGALRVLNDDHIAPHAGFGKHPHANMEIITIVTRGAITHEDSMGNRSVLSAGEIQVMSAGTGVVHSEENKGDEPLELFQIWIEPRTRNTTPRYEERAFPQKTTNTFDLLVSGDTNPDTLFIHQNAYISRGTFTAGAPFRYHIHNIHHGAYIFVVSGSIRIGETLLKARDACGVWKEEYIQGEVVDHASILVIEVPLFGY